MTVALSLDGRIVLEGRCPVHDAELLLGLLLDRPGVAVDWRACAEAHSAVVQVLLAAGVSPLGQPASAFLRDLIGPLLGAGAASPDTSTVPR